MANTYGRERDCMCLYMCVRESERERERERESVSVVSEREIGLNGALIIQ